VRLIRGVSPYTASWRELWRQADFFVMPTKHEAFGMVYQEAAAAGLPVVATNLNAIPEIVEDRVTGILVDAATFQPWSAPCGRLSNPQAFGTGWDSPLTDGLQRSPIRAPMP
jgi:glycosyltransferase involved in cell wall biosynthesis